jgi:hypothetical protein
MIMMMTDRTELPCPHFCLHFCFVSFTHSCQLQRPPSTGMSPLQFVTHLITPSDPRLPFHIATNLPVFFPLLVNIWHACQTLHYFSRLLSLRSTSQPAFFHFYLFCTQAANKHPKKLAIRVTSGPPPLILFKPARVHAPTFDYLCIYYPWRYLSRTKKKDLLGKRGTGAQKTRRS